MFSLKLVTIESTIIWISSDANFSASVWLDP
jgi:hypothetical protein